MIDYRRNNGKCVLWIVLNIEMNLQKKKIDSPTKKKESTMSLVSAHAEHYSSQSKPLMIINQSALGKNCNT